MRENPAPLYRAEVPKRKKNDRRLARISEAADYARVDVQTIRRRISDGTLTGWKFGRVVLVDLDEIDAAMTVVPTGA